ncbi:MAG TPA: DUF4251 domain-containing protein [Chitinophagaceae bacterium]|jgi:hypothetical protein
MKTILKTTLFLAVMVACAVAAPAQNAKNEEKAAAIKQLVDAQNYVFIAQTALPMSGRVRQLTGEMYDLTVTKTSVNAYLPYFGQAYTAPIDPSQGGIKFKTDSFSYTVMLRKKGGWDISIKPNGVADIQQLSLTISSLGYASLQVISGSKQAISYNGYIDAIPEKKKP